MKYDFTEPNNYCNVAARGTCLWSRSSPMPSMIAAAVALRHGRVVRDFNTGDTEDA
jgi:hypothetical protein